MRVCLIRHGLTTWNLAGRIQGRSDIPLSEEGRAQVAGWRLPDGFSGAPCVASPLRRALETAALLGFPDPATDPRLVEMRWGRFEGRRLVDLRAELGPELDAAERRGLDFRPPEGESPREVAGRLAAVLADFAGKADGAGRQCDHVVIAHKGILRAALVLTLGWQMTGPPPVAYEPERALILDLAIGGAPRFEAAVPLRPVSA